MSLNHNQLDAITSLPGSEFATGLGRLDAISEYGGPVALRYLGGHASLVGGAIAGERVPDADVSDYYAVRPAATPHVQDPEPGTPEALREVDRIAKEAIARRAAEHQEQEAARRAAEEAQTQQGQ